MREAWELHPSARASLERWVASVEAAAWRSMNDISSQGLFRPDPVGDDRVVFNIAGNAFRLVCAVDFLRGIVFVKWFGTHAAYETIDVSTVRHAP